MKTISKEDFEREQVYANAVTAAQAMLWYVSEFFDVAYPLDKFPDIRECCNMPNYDLDMLEDYLFDFVKENFDEEVCLQRFEVFGDVGHRIFTSKNAHIWSNGKDIVWRGQLSQLPIDMELEGKYKDTTSKTTAGKEAKRCILRMQDALQVFEY